MHDVAVVGAGPAGLAAATAACRLGADVVLIEQGKPMAQRSHDEPADVISGIGGAGLFSDGKYSFFPSATALWSVQPKRLLALAYAWLENTLSDAGMTVPPFPVESANYHLPPTSGYRRKNYPSFHLPASDRNAITQGLITSLGDCVQPGQYITQIDHLIDDHVQLHGTHGPVRARRAVLAPGRLGPLVFAPSFRCSELVFRRVELGIRLEQPADTFFLSGDRCLDPKLLNSQGSGRSWRTFCCCRNGLVVTTSAAGLTSVSGRADCPPTGYSSVGLLVRYTAARSGMAAWHEAKPIRPGEQPAVEPISDFMNSHGQVCSHSRIAHVLGYRTASHLVDAIKDLTRSINRPLTDATLHAPMIEGVGLYPHVGPDLQVPGRRLRVAGDATGIFRGLTAALISGFVAGTAAAEAAVARAS
jgi:uncharacterized protein